VFPLKSPSGETIGIQTRVLNEPESGPRYQQFYTYPQETYPYFFGFPQAFMPICALNQVVIVEGVFDYFAVKKYAENSLAILTAGVSVSSKNFFRRFTKRVISCLDNDEPGNTASERLKGSSYQVVRLPMLKAKDPGQLLAEGRDDPSLYRLLGLASQKL
jgi:DNA primase